MNDLRWLDKLEAVAIEALSEKFGEISEGVDARHLLLACLLARLYLSQEGKP